MHLGVTQGGEGRALEKIHDVSSAGVRVDVLWSHEKVKIVDIIIVHWDAGCTLA